MFTLAWCLLVTYAQYICPLNVFLGEKKNNIIIDYQNVLADWYLIIQSITKFTFHRIAISIKQICYVCTWPWLSSLEHLALFLYFMYGRK